VTKSNQHGEAVYALETNDFAVEATEREDASWRVLCSDCNRCKVGGKETKNSVRGRKHVCAVLL